MRTQFALCVALLLGLFGCDATSTGKTPSDVEKGGTAYLLMSEIIENGDELVIYEMFNADNPDATIEDYQVYLGYYTNDGDMAFTDEAFSDWNTGVVVGTVDGLW